MDNTERNIDMVNGMEKVTEVVSHLRQDFEQRGGLRHIVFVACGGSLSSSYPARYLLDSEGRSLRVAGYNSGEFVHATPKFVSENTLVVGTSTKATAETVEALETARKHGALTVALTGDPDSKTAQAAHYALTYFHGDEWYQNPTLVHCNSQGTTMKLAVRLLKEFEGFPLYDRFMDGFSKLEDVYAKAYRELKPAAAQFAMRYRNDTIFNVLRWPIQTRFASSRRCRRSTASPATAENTSMGRLRPPMKIWLCCCSKAWAGHAPWTSGWSSSSLGSEGTTISWMPWSWDLERWMRRWRNTSTPCSSIPFPSSSFPLWEMCACIP